MQLTIHNINNLKTIDYRELTNLQGDLKELDEQNEIKLKNVLEKRGFRAPVFVYRDKGGSIYLMDGHQRQAVMTKYDMNDNGNYAVPYVEIPAKDLQEAQAILLEITSQYGTLTKEGLDNYLKLAKLPVAETMKPIALLAYQLDNSTKEGDIVLDSFLGSGSTLVAAEQMNRTCYGLELDPRFVDVIRKRYWKLTHDDKEDGWEAGTPLLQA